MGMVIMGLFDEQQQAVRAQAALQAMGIPLTQMSLVNQSGPETATKGQADNWWERLKDLLGFGVHQEDLPYYHEGLRRGGTLLTVQTDESRENEVAGIFADHNAIDIDTRLVSQFQQKGLGPVVSSWVGTGDNVPISPTDLTRGLGQENINEIAAQSGLPPETASEQLAQVFPSLIDKLTPQGHVPEQSLVSQGLQILMSQLGSR